VLVRVEQGEPDARSQPVVARGQAAPVGIQELLAVDDGAVREHPHRVRPLARIVHIEHAVEVARPDPGIGGILCVRPEQGDGEPGRQREKYDPGGDSKASVEDACPVAQQRGDHEQREREHADRQLVEVLEQVGREPARASRPPAAPPRASMR